MALTKSGVAATVASGAVGITGATLYTIYGGGWQLAGDAAAWSCEAMGDPIELCYDVTHYGIGIAGTAGLAAGGALATRLMLWGANAVVTLVGWNPLCPNECASSRSNYRSIV